MDQDFNVEIKNVGSGFMVIVSRNNRIIYKDVVSFDFLLKKEKELMVEERINEGIHDE